jgi:hypothetical protein
MKAVLDNDILYKGTCFGLLPALLAPYGGIHKGIGILGAAHFVVSRKIKRGNFSRGRGAVLVEFLLWTSGLTKLEPTETEQTLAAEFESLAQRAGVNLDGGESQLCAMVVERVLPVLLTGDKRAIVAAERLFDSHHRLPGLSGKFRCLEQAILDILETTGPVVVRKAICSEPRVDTALSICFSCVSSDTGLDHISEGLNSYVGHLRAAASRVLGA